MTLYAVSMTQTTVTTNHSLSTKDKAPMETEGEAAISLTRRTIRREGARHSTLLPYKGETTNKHLKQHNVVRWLNTSGLGKFKKRDILPKSQLTSTYKRLTDSQKTNVTQDLSVAQTVHSSNGSHEANIEWSEANLRLSFLYMASTLNTWVIVLIHELLQF